MEGLGGQITDVVTAIKPSYLVENMPDSEECSPHPYLNVPKTNDLFFILFLASDNRWPVEEEANAQVC